METQKLTPKSAILAALTDLHESIEDDFLEHCLYCIRLTIIKVGYFEGCDSDLLLEETPDLLNDRNTAIAALLEYLSDKPDLTQRILEAAQNYEPDPQITFSEPLELKLENKNQVVLEEDGILFVKREQLELWSANGFSLYGKLPSDTPIEFAKLAMQFYRKGKSEGECMGRFDESFVDQMRWALL